MEISRLAHPFFLYQPVCFKKLLYIIFLEKKFKIFDITKIMKKP